MKINKTSDKLLEVIKELESLGDIRLDTIINNLKEEESNLDTYIMNLEYGD